MIRVQSAEEHALALDVIQIDGGTQSRATPDGQAIKDVPLALIAADTQAQPRKYIKTDVWKDYQEAMERGDIFPPVAVFHDGTKYWLADGFHRFYAARGIGRTAIRCEIHQGGLRDAVLYSVGVNHAHGLQRTDADRRRAIMLLLEDEEWGAWSDREIARRCKVHHTTVARVKADIRAFYRGEARDAGGKYRPGRETVFDDPRVERITGDVASDGHGRKFRSKHGTVATMKTAGINASRKGGDEKQEITPETVAPQGVEGGVEAASADMEITTSESARENFGVDAEGDADAIQWAWDLSCEHGRAIFLAANNLTEQPKVETHDAEAHKPNSNAVAPASSETDGRANVEQVDVDRSAERASSAVEVGAPVSPDGAAVSASSGRPEGSERLQVHREPRNAAEPDAGQSKREEIGTERGVSPCVTAGETAAGETGMVLGTGRERPLSVGGDADGDPEARFESASLHQSPSTAPTVEAVATPQAPQPIATATRPRSMSITPLEPREAGGLKGFGFTVNFSDPRPTSSPDADMAGELQDRNEPVSSSPASPRLNPDCQKAARGEPCALSHSMASCSACANAAMKARMQARSA